MLGNRAAEAEFEPVRRAVENAPIATDRPFERTLPGLIERLDDIDLEVLALGERQRFADDARLVPGRRPRALAHAPRARPAEFTDEDVLAGNGGRDPRVDRGDVGGRKRGRDRKILPVRQNMDRDEIDGVAHVAIAQPVFPDVGVGDRLCHLRLDLADGGHEIGRRHLPAQQHFVADDDGADDVGIFLGERGVVAICRRFLSALLESQTPCSTFSPCRRALARTLSAPSSIE